MRRFMELATVLCRMSRLIQMKEMIQTAISLHQATILNQQTPPTSKSNLSSFVRILACSKLLRPITNQIRPTSKTTWRRSMQRSYLAWMTLITRTRAKTKKTTHHKTNYLAGMKQVMSRVWSTAGFSQVRLKWQGCHPKRGVSSSLIMVKITVNTKAMSSTYRSSSHLVKHCRFQTGTSLNVLIGR